MSSYTFLARPSYCLMPLIIIFLPLTLLLCVTFLAPLIPAYPPSPGAACFNGADVGVAPMVAPAPTPDDRDHRPPAPELSVLIGVHTVAKKRSRRHLIRMAYALQLTEALRRAARVDVRFALCARPMAPELRAFVALEARVHGDVLLFDCVERADRGKTYTYFAGLPAMLAADGDGDGVDARPYDYVMKVDDDTYLRLEALVETLRRAPREDMYYGVGLPFMDRKSPPFMLGMGYVLSWDLVQWIATSDMVRSQATGPEDVTTGKWLNMGNKAKNRVNIYPRMYDYKSAQAEDFLENTIGVHQLKEDLRWAHTLEHFNVTLLEPFGKLKNL